MHCFICKCDKRSGLAQVPYCSSDYFLSELGWGYNWTWVIRKNNVKGKVLILFSHNSANELLIEKTYLQTAFNGSLFSAVLHVGKWFFCAKRWQNGLMCEFLFIFSLNRNAQRLSELKNCQTTQCLRVRL